MAVQSNQASEPTAGSELTLTCAFTNPVTASDSISVCICISSFVAVSVLSVTDNAGGGAGNSYTFQQTFNGGTGGGQTQWLYTAVNAIAGATTVTVVISAGSFNQPFTIFIVEGPSASSVRVSNVGSATFGGTTASVSLAGTVSGDYVVAFAGESGATGAPITPGSVGTNAATEQQAAAPGGDENYVYLVEDGASSGGTINATATVESGTVYWAVLAAAFVPGAAAPTPQDPIGFGVDA